MFKINIIFLFVVAIGLADAALVLDNESELREAQAALFNVNSVSGWMLLNYVGPNKVRFAAAGEGTVEDLKANLENDQIQYGVIRIPVTEKGTSKRTIRDVFIVWIGRGVSTVEKGNKREHIRDAQSLLQPYHAEVTVLNNDHFTDETLADRSHPLSGSHVID